MSGGNLSRIENGEQGPPSDEVIIRIAEALDIDDASDLFRAAGRSVAEFEDRVLTELRQIRREMHARFSRLEGR
jgi:transcriptional regulator with XRE-family HTH domain